MSDELDYEYYRVYYKIDRYFNQYLTLRFAKD